jgi:hypothetical protein
VIEGDNKKNWPAWQRSRWPVEGGKLAAMKWGAGVRRASLRNHLKISVSHQYDRQDLLESQPMLR